MINILSTLFWCFVGIILIVTSLDDIGAFLNTGHLSYVRYYGTTTVSGYTALSISIAGLLMGIASIVLGINSYKKLRSQ